MLVLVTEKEETGETVRYKQLTVDEVRAALDKWREGVPWPSTWAFLVIAGNHRLHACLSLIEAKHDLARETPPAP